MQAARENAPRFVAGFARIQYVPNSGESSYGCFPTAARLKTTVRSVEQKNGWGIISVLPNKILRKLANSLHGLVKNRRLVLRYAAWLARRSFES